MSIQKFRSDIKASPCPNGAIEHFSSWLFGLSLSKIERCPLEGSDFWMTVYIQSEPDTFFTQPAAIQFRNRTIRGFISRDESGPRFYVSRS